MVETLVACARTWPHVTMHEADICVFSHGLRLSSQGPPRCAGSGRTPKFLQSLIDSPSTTTSRLTATLKKGFASQLTLWLT